MALTLAAQAANWHPLVEIADCVVDGVAAQTVRWSDVALALSDNTYYAPRLLSMSALREELGRILEPQFVSPDMTLTLDNTDDALRALLDANRKFAGKVVTLKVGQGTDVADYSVLFTGRVRFPDWGSWGTRTLQLSLDNGLGADSLTLPKNKVWPSTYPNAEAKSLYCPIPEILGDWRTTAGGGETVPCYCIDTTHGTGGQFIVAEHCEVLEAVYKNGAAVSFTQDSLTPCLFTLNVAYATATDSITANVRGRISTLNSLDTCVEWAYDLLAQSWGMGMAAGRIDATAFDAVADAHFVSTDAARRWIGTETATSTFMGELGVEGFFDLIINAAGKYEPVFRTPDPSDAWIFREVDIETSSSGDTSLSVLGDPERIYANDLPYDYRLRAGRWQSSMMNTDDSYATAGFLESTSEKTAVGQTVRRRLRLKWLYLDDGADDRAGRERLACATDVEMVNLTLGPRALDLKPADVFSLIYGKYEVLPGAGTYFSVRSVEPDYMAMTASVTAWNIYSLRARLYQANGAAAWGAATAADKEIYGYYSEPGQTYA